jgi:hypothetical protein
MTKLLALSVKSLLLAVVDLVVRVPPLLIPVAGAVQAVY